ncbi:MAG: hypothetical protein NT069_07300, partial [Planctomycetota bacterium]|nr:hypothetical protein [Planctomycetota bacterium]
RLNMGTDRIGGETAAVSCHTRMFVDITVFPGATRLEVSTRLELQFEPPTQSADFDSLEKSRRILPNPPRGCNQSP